MSRSKPPTAGLMAGRPSLETGAKDWGKLGRQGQNRALPQSPYSRTIGGLGQGCPGSPNQTGAPRDWGRSTEDALQRVVVTALRLALPKAVVWATPNAARRMQAGRAANAVPGLLPGVPDLFILQDGCLYGVELKAPGKRATPSAEQETVMAALTAAGAHCVTANSLEAVLTACRGWGLPLRIQETTP